MYRLFESFARKVEEQANEQATLNRGTDGRLCNEMEIGHAACAAPLPSPPSPSPSSPTKSLSPPHSLFHHKGDNFGPLFSSRRPFAMCLGPLLGYKRAISRGKTQV